MSDTALKFENISKQYRLGDIGTGTLSNDIHRWWTMNIKGEEDPNLLVGQVNDRSTKASGDFVWALRDIEFEVKKGEVLGIVGNNGAGKSTLLKILSRVTSPTTGRIRAQGRIASLLEVGTGFHPEMTGRENIYMNGSIMGMNKAEIIRKLDEIIDFSGVEKYIDTPVKRYSSGMTVRLGFAIAAYLEPEILVVDEVLAVGDAEFQKKAIGKMQDVSKSEGRTVLFVSHNMLAVRQLCTRAILLEDGTISCDDSVEKTLERYLNVERKFVFNTDNPISYNNNRRSSGHVKFTSVIIHDNIKRKRYKFIIGESIQFTLSYEVLEELDGLEVNVRFLSGSAKEIITNVRHTLTEDIARAGTKGTVTVELTQNPFRPGEYPLCFDINDTLTRSKYETLDDITNPIIITADDNVIYRDFNPLKPVGFFSIPSSRVVESTIHKI